MSIMKLAGLAVALLIIVSCGVSEQPQAQPKYEATWESLQQYEAPEWFKDAKYGIFIHWGVYAVPAFGNEWYPRRMYQQYRTLATGELREQTKTVDPVWTHHMETYGGPAKFGYKDFIPMFKAEKWNPDEWAELFSKAGAKYVVPVAEHHDGFPMYDSSHTTWDSVEMGPKRDVVGELKTAVEARGMRFGASSHRAFNRAYYTRNQDWDTADPANAGLYGLMQPNIKATTAPKEFLDDWYARTIEIVDKYQPEVLWFDFAMNYPEFQPYLQRLAAHYYNKSAGWGREPVLQYKAVHEAWFPDGTAVLDIERGRLKDIREMVWQTDTSLSKRSWGYIEDDEFKSADSLVDVLVDIVSKNGCLLLNVGPRADGTIPDEARETLLEIGKWLEVNGEAIYGTRPWKVFGEGPTKITQGAFSEQKDAGYAAEDIRFTTRGDTLYVIALGWPAQQMTVKSVTRKVSAVRLLGMDEDLKFTQDENGLAVGMPGAKVGDYAFVFKVSF